MGFRIIPYITCKHCKPGKLSHLMSNSTHKNAPGFDVGEIAVTDQNRVKYRSSLKGSYQLVLDGFPYTRHRIRGGTIYWRCVQFRPLNCKARVRTNPSGDRVSIVDEDHNHGILKERRKKGSLKCVYEQHTFQSYIRPESKPFLINKRAPYQRKTVKKFTPKIETTKIHLEMINTTSANDEPIITSSIILDKPTIEPLDKQVVQSQLNNPKSVLKTASNDHTFSVVNRKRVLGLCVYCLRKPNADKRKLVKITSFCPKCPGGCWMCEPCFDEIHSL